MFTKKLQKCQTLNETQVKKLKHDTVKQIRL